MLCKNCLTLRGLTPLNSSPEFCSNCKTDYDLKQTKLYSNESRVIDLSPEIKTLLMGIDKNRVTLSIKNESYLIELYNLGLIYHKQLTLTPTGMEWLGYLLDNDTDAKPYHSKLKLLPIGSMVY